MLAATTSWEGPQPTIPTAGIIRDMVLPVTFKSPALHMKHLSPDRDPRDPLCTSDPGIRACRKYRIWRLSALRTIWALSPSGNRSDVTLCIDRAGEPSLG